MPEYLLEACVETLEQAILAEQCGAHRIELCDRLDLGGITPSEELIRSCLKNLSIPIIVMIRPRRGDFTCTAGELEQMKNSITFCKEAGVHGVVFGILNKEGQIDMDQNRELAKHAAPLQVTFHKAIDQLNDPVGGVIQIRSIPHFTRILTSGGASTALEGQGVIRKMIEAGGNHLTMVAAGKITKENLAEVQKATGAVELHGKRIVF